MMAMEPSPAPDDGGQWTLTPGAVIEKLASVDSGAARLIYAGLAVFAAVALIFAWNIEIETAGLVAVYLILFGVLVIVLANFHGMIAIWLARFLGVMIGVFVFAVTFSALLPRYSPFPPVPCMIRVWQFLDDSRCENVLDVIVAAKDLPPPPKIATAVENSVDTEIDRGQFRVFPHFAGDIRREDAISAAKAIADLGWNMQTNRGGERLAAASGLNEVRYSDAGDKAAAEQLAVEYQNANLTGKPVSIRQYGGTPPIPKGTLEVWLSR